VSRFCLFNILFLYRYVVFSTDYGPTAALDTPQTRTSTTIISPNPPFYLYAPGRTDLSQHTKISELLQSLPKLQETLNQPHSQIISNIHSLVYPNSNHAVWSVDNNGHLFQVHITAIDKIFQQRLLNRLYSIYNNRCNYWTTPEHLHEQFTIPCKHLQLPLPTNLRKSMMEHMVTQDSLSLYLEHKGLRPKGSAWPPADALHHCLLHSVISPTVLQAVRVADILKRNTVLIMPTNSQVWTSELVYLPGDIDRLITQTLLESADNHNCIQNYLLSYKAKVTSTGGEDTVTSSNNDAKTGSNYSVTDGLKTFTQNIAEVAWNEEKKESNLSDKSCIESKGHTTRAGDTTFVTTPSYNSGVPAEATVTFTKQIQRNTAASYDQIPAKTRTPSQIEIPVTNTTAHDSTVPAKCTITYRREMNENTNVTTYQEETLNKTITSYHNIQGESAADYHTKLQDAPTVDLKPATVKTTTPYQGKILLKNTTYQSDFRVERTTKDDLDHTTTNTEFVTARNLQKATNDELHERKTTMEFVTARNLMKTTNNELDDRKTTMEFVTARNLLETTNNELDDRNTAMEFVTARNLLETTNNELDDRKTTMEFVTARNLLETTNNDLDDRKTTMEFVTARNLLETINNEMDDRNTTVEFVTARNLLETTNNELDGRNITMEFVTARNLLETTNNELADRKTTMEFVTARNLLETTNNKLDDRNTTMEFVTARNLLETTNNELDDRKTTMEFVTARNSLETTNNKLDDRKTTMEFVTARNSLETTNNELDDRKTTMEFVTARNLLETTNNELDDRNTTMEFVTARNLLETTNNELDDRKTTMEFVTARNPLETTNNELDDRKTTMEFVTARNPLETTNNELDDRKTTMEFVTARNLLETTNKELDDRNTTIEFVTARNPLETTNNELDDRNTTMEFVTARNLLETTNKELDDRNTTIEFVNAWNLLETTTNELDDRKTTMEFVTARNLLETTNNELDDRNTTMEFVTARNSLEKTDNELDDRKTTMEFVTARNLLETTNNELDDRNTTMEFVTARNLLETTDNELDDRKTTMEFVTARNLLETTNNELDDRNTTMEFVTARNLPKTTNDDLDDTTTITKFVTTGKLLQTVVYGLHVRKTQPTNTSAWNLLKTTTSISSDSTTGTAYSTPRDVLQRSTESLKGSTTKPELVTSRDVVHTVTASLTDITEDTQLDIRVTQFEEPSGGLTVGEVAACEGTKIQLEVTTRGPGGTTGPLKTVDTTEPQFECDNCMVQSTTQSVSDLIQVSSPVLKDTIAISPDDLANQPPVLTTASSTEPTTNTDHDTITEVKSDARGVTHFNVSNQAMPVTEESLSNVSNASHATLDNGADIFGQTTEHSQTLYNSTSADIFEIMEQMVNSTISPAELLTLQILYELLLTKYEVAHVSDDTKTPGGTNTTHRVPQNGVSSEIRNTVKVLEHIPGIMDDRILDNVTDEEINSLREAVEYVWSVVENETAMNINSSLVKIYQGAGRFVNRSTRSLMPEINRNRPKRQTTDWVLGQEAEVHKSAGSPLGFIIRSVSYSDKNGLEEKISLPVTGNVITDLLSQDTRNAHEEGNLL